MAIRIIHGNGDLYGAAAAGLGEGAAAIQQARNVDRELDDREARTGIIQQEADRRASTMQAQLAMDQEAHDAAMTEFNRRMLEQEAQDAFRHQALDLGPDQFDEEEALLDGAGLSPEDYALERDRIRFERQEFQIQQLADGKRAAITSMIERDPELAASTPTLAAIADGKIDLSMMSPAEVDETLKIAESERDAAQDKRQDLLSYQRAGQYVDKILSNPETPLALTDSLPSFLRSMSLEDRPAVMERFLAGMAGEIPPAALYDDGPVEAVMNQWSQYQRQQRFAQTPEGRAAIQEQARGGSLGTGQPGPSDGPQGAPSELTKPGDAAFQREIVSRDPLDASVEKARTTREREMFEAYQQSGDAEDPKAAARFAKRYGKQLEADLRATGGKVPASWMEPNYRKSIFFDLLREYDKMRDEPTAPDGGSKLDYILSLAEKRGMLTDEALKAKLAGLFARPEDEARTILQNLPDSDSPFRALEKLGGYDRNYFSDLWWNLQQQGKQGKRREKKAREEDMATRKAFPGQGMKPTQLQQ